MDYLIGALRVLSVVLYVVAMILGFAGRIVAAILK